MKAFLLSFVVAFLLVAAPAALFADEPELEFVVTADRVLTDITSTAAHVSIITAEDIRRSGATNVPELLSRRPGVSFTSFSHEAEAQIDMRGFGEGSSSRVLVLIDGRKQNQPDLSEINWLSIPIDSIERIEVVRGGASALYGNHAIGGVINIITKTPERPLEVTAFGSFGSYLTNQERLGLQHAGERYRLRASGEHFSTDGYRDRSAYRALNFSLAGEFDPTDTITVSLGGRYANVFYELPGGLTEDEFDDDPTQATNEDDENTENQFGLDAGVQWRIGEPADAELQLGYLLKRVESDFTSQGSFTDTDLHRVTASPSVTLDWAAGQVPMRTRLGGDWSWARQEGTSYLTAERDDKDFEFTLAQNTVGGSLSNTAFLTEQLDLTGAVRYDRSTISAEKEDADIDDSTTHQAVVFDLGAVYRPVEFAKLYVTGGTLFRYPALDEQADVNFADQFEDDLDPERGFNVELGGGLYLGRFLQTEVSAYWLQMRDEIAFVTDPVTFEGSNVNLDETRRLGGDLSLESEPIELLRLSAGYSYVWATFIAGDDDGNEVPLVPNHRANAELGVRPVEGLEFGPAVSYTSTAYQGGDTANAQDKIDDYFLTDLYVRFRPAAVPGDLSLSAEVKNVFDISYSPLVSGFDDGTQWVEAYYPAAGRNFRISASYAY